MRRLSLLLCVVLLSHCGGDALTSSKNRVEACHFLEVDVWVARPDGYPCYPAKCSDDGTSYTQRGSCFNNGTVCSVPKDPVLCSPTEFCLETSAGDNTTQALCIDKDMGK